MTTSGGEEINIMPLEQVLAVVEGIDPTMEPILDGDSTLADLRARMVGAYHTAKRHPDSPEVSADLWDIHAGLYNVEAEMATLLNPAYWRLLAQFNESQFPN